mmetsp:Transcript_4266/g.7897  ORF Transcript_4266/g.7897 Transcript_4266/m.7897 type:complete len:332 (-) Transcript_4266:1512-2507(-)
MAKHIIINFHRVVCLEIENRAFLQPVYRLRHRPDAVVIIFYFRSKAKAVSDKTIAVPGGTQACVLLKRHITNSHGKPDRLTLHDIVNPQDCHRRLKIDHVCQAGEDKVALPNELGLQINKGIVQWGQRRQCLVLLHGRVMLLPTVGHVRQSGRKLLPWPQEHSASVRHRHKYIEAITAHVAHFAQFWGEPRHSTQLHRDHVGLLAAVDGRTQFLGNLRLKALAHLLLLLRTDFLFSVQIVKLIILREDSALRLFPWELEQKGVCRAQPHAVIVFQLHALHCFAIDQAAAVAGLEPNVPIFRPLHDAVPLVNTEAVKFDLRRTDLIFLPDEC